MSPLRRTGRWYAMGHSSPTMSRRSVALSLLLCACATYSERPLDVNTMADELAARRVADAEVQRAVITFTGTAPACWPPTALDLQQAFAIALHCRTELRTARATLLAARSRHDAAEEWPDPTVSISPGLVTNPAGAIPRLFSIGVSMPLDLGGKRRAAVEAASSEIGAAMIVVLRADQAIRAEVVERAAEARLRARLAELLEKNASIADAASRVAAARVRAGAAPATTQALADATAARARAESATAQAASRSARLDLERTLGLAPGALEGLPVDLPEPDLPSTFCKSDDLMSRSPDVGAAMCAYLRAEADLRLAYAARWPDVDLGPGFEYDQGLHKLRLDIGFAVPLFHGNGAAIAESTAHRTAAAAKVESAILEVLATSERAALTLAQRRAELDSAVAVRASTRAAATLADARVAAGTDDRSTQLDASRALVEAEIAEARARHDLYTAWITAELAMQEPIGPGVLAWTRPTPDENP